MDAEEIGRLIGELENRVERLRSLYEQYFMGIERIEPLVMRKDIDRRLWALRREQIRNTGLRFKLETTIQRYNTYQQYWQRIVREIEQGTYQRDFGRAAQRFGENVVTAFGRRRQKMFEKGLAKKAERDGQHGPGDTQASPDEASGGASASSNETFDVTFDDAEADPASSQRRVPPPAAPPVASAPLAPRPAAAPAPTTANARPAVPAVPARPGPIPPPVPPPRTPFASSAGQAPPVPPPRTPFASSAGHGAPLTPTATPAKPIMAATTAANPAPPVKPFAPIPPVKPSAPIATPTAAMPPGAAGAARPSPVVRPAPATSGVPTTAKPAVPPVTPAERPPVARPAAASRPDARPPAMQGEDNGLSPIRLRQIYGAFVEAKRKANESTASVTYEKIASNLETVAKELRAKHKARSVDFEVVLKNGKPVLKPVVKG